MDVTGGNVRDPYGCNHQESDFSNTESQEKGTTVADSIGDKRLIGSVGKRSEAEDE